MSKNKIDLSEEFSFISLDQIEFYDIYLLKYIKNLKAKRLRLKKYKNILKKN